jgi:gliding motility-associated-like protein
VNTSNTYDVEVTDGNGCKGRDTIVVGINQLPIVDLGNDTSICADSLIVFDAGNTTAGWLWSNAETTQQISVDTASSYSVIVTDTNGCVGNDTLVLSIDTLPVVFLGVDTAICADSTLLLDAQNVGGTYLWNTGVNSRTINVNSSGTYDVVVTTTKGCVGYDTIALDINQLPTPDLGIDSSLCSGDAMELFTGLSDISLLWIPTNETTDTIVVSTAGTYEVMVTDTNNCVGYDTVVVTVDALPIVDLGIDSSLCAGDEMTIYAGNAGSTYVWNNGSTDENITIDSAFTYIVTVTNPAICSVSDTVVVTVDSVPVVDLGMDTAICNLDSITFDAGNAGAMFAWSTGSSNQSILVKSSGSYRVTVTNSFNCVTEDTVNLEINELPDVDLGPTRDVCEYLYIDLGVAEQGAISYAWSTGATTDSISINTAGTYYLDVVDTNNCFKSDTVVVTPGPDLVVEIEADSVICAGEETEATVLVDNETGLLSYTWNTTATTESIEVNTTGTYSVVVIDAKGCWGDDSQGIRVQALPTLTITPDTLSMCSMEEAEETSFITAAHNGSYVEWGDGFIGDVYTTEESGWFEATVMDDFGCSAYDSVTIVEYCRPINITLPNIFTPDGDGINDAFIPFEIVWEDLEYMMAHIEYINFKVYNRWGELIHLSTEVLPRWKGLNARGVDAPDGTYFWTLEYRDIDGGEYFNNGYVKLRR